MTILRRALVSHSVLVGMLLIELAVYYPRLPDRVASHFGASGEPDGWQSKQAFTTFTIAFPIVLAALMIGAQATMLYL
ncbi:MAG TPA: DUF1648 domain-containing protein, partial [Phycisphaerae bacterium]|nr:DUF1648 domain-containing protein [Phycisphaerae bacterium]